MFHHSKANIHYAQANTYCTAIYLLKYIYFYYYAIAENIKKRTFPLRCEKITDPQILSNAVAPGWQSQGHYLVRLLISACGYLSLLHMATQPQYVQNWYCILKLSNLSSITDQTRKTRFHAIVSHYEMVSLNNVKVANYLAKLSHFIVKLLKNN